MSRLGAEPIQKPGPTTPTPTSSMMLSRTNASSRRRLRYTAAGMTCTRRCGRRRRSGTPDTGAPDTGTPDTGTPETGRPDTGAPDTGAPETGAPETGAPETGTDEAGTPDTERGRLTGRRPGT